MFSFKKYFIFKKYLENMYFVSILVHISNPIYKNTLYLISRILYLKVSCNLYSRYFLWDILYISDRERLIPSPRSTKYLNLPTRVTIYRYCSSLDRWCTGILIPQTLNILNSNQRRAIRITKNLPSLLAPSHVRPLSHLWFKKLTLPKRRDHFRCMFLNKRSSSSSSLSTQS